MATQPPPQPPPTTTMTSVDELPTSTADTVPAMSKSKKLTLIPLIFLIYFEVAGGPYGEEPAVQAAGPLFAILGFTIFPFIWSIPEALITAELSTAFPGNGGFVIWADRAFGPFFGSLMGTWKFLSGVINIAAFPALCINYLKRIFPLFESGRPRTIAILVSTAVLSFLNFTGLAIVGYVAVALGVVSLAPFLLMSGIAAPQMQPRRLISLGQKGVKKDWNLFFNTLFWNLNFWDNVSTMAGEVENPKKTFPKALFWAVVLTCLGYLIPLVFVAGAVEVDQSLWETGFMADAARTISGQWLKLWIEIGAVLSAIGLFEAQLSSSAYQIEGMSELAFLPKFFGLRSKRFDTPWVGIAVSTAIALGVSFMSYENIVSSANFLYSLGMLLEFAAFLYLRVKMPQLKRPFKVPLRLPVLVVLCLVPSGFLVYIMVIAKLPVFLVSAGMTVGGVGWFFLMKLCRVKGWFVFTRVERPEE